MFVEFNGYYNASIHVNPDKVVYIYPSQEEITWIVFGPDDFEIRVRHPYAYVVEQLSKSKQEKQV